MSEDPLNGTSSKEYLRDQIKSLSERVFDGLTAHERAEEKLAAEREKATDKLDAQREARYDEKFAAKDYAVKIATEAARDASEKALSSVDRRLEAFERVSTTTNETVATLLPRPEYAAAHQALVDLITVMGTAESKAQVALMERVDEKIGVIATALQTAKDETQKQYGRFTWWLIGLLGGVTVSLFMALIGFILNK